MKKIYRIILLSIVLVFLSTYNPYQSNLIPKEDNNFFKIQTIEIENNLLIDKNIIKERLNKIYNKNIFLIKSADIEQPLNKINFLNKIEVKKKYPNTVIIKVYETKPLAILFKDKSKHIIDSSANLISLKEEMNYGELPGVFGKGAEKNFLNFFQKLKKSKFPEDQIKNFYYFQIGRWDLQLTNDKLIKLPYNNTDDAIKKSIELLNRKDFENYNVIDLRVNGKIVVE